MLRRVLASSSSVSPSACISSSSSSPLAWFSGSAQLAEASRGLKSRKRPKVSGKFIKDSQAWREEYQSEQQRLLADSLRGYVSYSTTRRIAPYDTRFRPFDREETDGVYVIMRHLMKDKMDLSRNHAHVVKRLMCNVGLVGPQVTTQARWRPLRASRISEKSVTMKDYMNERDKSLKARLYSD